MNDSAWCRGTAGAGQAGLRESTLHLRLEDKSWFRILVSPNTSFGRIHGSLSTSLHFFFRDQVAMSGYHVDDICDGGDQAAPLCGHSQGGRLLRHWPG